MVSYFVEPARSFFLNAIPYPNVNSTPSSFRSSRFSIRMNPMIMTGLRVTQGVFMVIVLGTTAYGMPLSLRIAQSGDIMHLKSSILTANPSYNLVDQLLA